MSPFHTLFHSPYPSESHILCKKCNRKGVFWTKFSEKTPTPPPFLLLILPFLLSCWVRVSLRVQLESSGWTHREEDWTLLLLAITGRLALVGKVLFPNDLLFAGFAAFVGISINCDMRLLFTKLDVTLLSSIGNCKLLSRSCLMRAACFAKPVSVMMCDGGEGLKGLTESTRSSVFWDGEKSCFDDSLFRFALDMVSWLKLDLDLVTVCELILLDACPLPDLRCLPEDLLFFFPDLVLEFIDLFRDVEAWSGSTSANMLSLTLIPTGLLS